jgi:mannosylglycoprotein endo-beta-mannosidase
MWDGFADGEGGWSDGPYGIQNPEDFFNDDFYAHAFNPEIGSVGVPSAATIRATMPKEAWEPPQIIYTDRDVEEITNPTWDYHKYLPYAGYASFYTRKTGPHQAASDREPKDLNYLCRKAGRYVPHQIAAYGKPRDLDDFCYKVWEVEAHLSES